MESNAAWEKTKEILKKLTKWILLIVVIIIIVLIILYVVRAIMSYMYEQKFSVSVVPDTVTHGGWWTVINDIGNLFNELSNKNPTGS